MTSVSGSLSTCAIVILWLYIHTLGMSGSTASDGTQTASERESPYDACDRLLADLDEEFSGIWELSETGCRMACSSLDRFPVVSEGKAESEEDKESENEAIESSMIQMIINQGRECRNSSGTQGVS